MLKIENRLYQDPSIIYQSRSCATETVCWGHVSIFISSYHVWKTLFIDSSCILYSFWFRPIVGRSLALVLFPLRRRPWSHDTLIKSSLKIDDFINCIVYWKIYITRQTTHKAETSNTEPKNCSFEIRCVTGLFFAVANLHIWSKAMIMCNTSGIINKRSLKTWWSCPSCFITFVTTEKKIVDYKFEYLKIKLAIR